MKYLVLDFGGSALKHAVMDDEFGISELGSIPGKPETHEEFVQRIVDMYEASGRPEGGIAISYCGEMNEETGDIYGGLSYGYNIGTNLNEDLEARCGCRVSTEHDGRAAALAELTCGSLEGYRDGLVIVVGSGLGGGIILDGKVLHGSHKFGGALSFITTSVDADVVEFGEHPSDTFSFSYLGHAALTTGYAAACAGVPDAKLPADGKEFFALVEAGDEIAAAVLRTYCRRLAHLILNLQFVLDVQKISVGGGISQASALERVLREEFDRVFDFDMLRMAGFTKPELGICAFHNEANLIGALAHHKARLQ